MRGINSGTLSDAARRKQMGEASIGKIIPAMLEEGVGEQQPRRLLTTFSRQMGNQRRCRNRHGRSPLTSTKLRTSSRRGKQRQGYG